jgi:drug/metabolite transporter (DMT)-like permease
MLSVTLIWGLNFSVMKALYQYFHPLAFTVLRFLVATFALTAILRLRGVQLGIAMRDLPALIFLGVLSNTIYQILFVNGLATTTAGNAGLLMASTPVFAYLTGVFLKREQFRRAVLGGILLSVSGVAAIMIYGTGKLTLGSDWLGDAMVLAAAMCWGCYSGASARLILKYGAMRVTHWVMLTGTIAMLPVLSPWAIHQDWSSIPPRGWLAFAYSTFLSIVYCYLIWSHGIQRIGVPRTVVYSNITPIIALFGAWVMLRERPSLGQLAGIALILAGVFVVRSLEAAGLSRIASFAAQLSSRELRWSREMSCVGRSRKRAPRED